MSYQRQTPRWTTLAPLNGYRPSIFASRTERRIRRKRSIYLGIVDAYGGRPCRVGILRSPKSVLRVLKMAEKSGWYGA